MSRNRRGAGLAVWSTAAGLLVGAIAGFFAAYRGMDGMSGMRGHGMDGMSMEEIEGATSRGDRQGVSVERTTAMKGMGPGGDTSDVPSVAVTVPAVVRQSIGVRSAPVGYAMLEQEIRAVGTVGYDERGFTQVTLKTSGWVREVFVNSTGQPVRKGEPLLTFYSPDLLATQEEYLLAVRAQAQLAASPLPDAKEHAAALVASARERLRLWDVTDEQIATLERRGQGSPVLTVYAPSSGIVMRREALPGKYVEPGTILYEIADLSTVWIHAEIYESEMAAVKVGLPVTVTFAAYPGKSFHGKVAYVSPTLNTGARTVRVRLELPNPKLTLKPGMYGNVVVRTDMGKTLVMPKEAVLDTGLRQLVFIDRGEGRYEPMAVKLGRQGRDRVEILEGLKEGDRVVTSANFLLDAESKLTSASSMQAMMGRIGMGDWQMRGAYEAKMEGMEGMSGMQGMKGMESMKGMEEMPGMKDMSGMSGMDSGSGKAVSETRVADGYILNFRTLPETPKAGEALLKLKLTDRTGKPVTNAQVLFVYTMPMPGMIDSKAPAHHINDGLYEGTVLFGMAGTWVVTVNVTVPGQPPIVERFRFSVAVGGL
ncbi:efflux RND transporter periplasmic adaptor subunit [Candidatus Nitrospira inopinata]|uniref:Efflux transporter, RND family, MFP subunit (Modular protein) n=1 Tax=Candidatus Nitrospira inopinata TaxID=1715989 RepID=A0A0S4KSM3_9BACT|nr:efflux RND transporter periplasmic adaptor subunit [Candidatus Nitrospira inopinata]CUQ65348.1 Efflux transporter, RND family, MFP subunit (modular protein) [Candidatus Nitrospira inopinata]